MKTWPIDNPRVWVVLWRGDDDPSWNIDYSTMARTRSAAIGLWATGTLEPGAIQDWPKRQRNGEVRCVRGVFSVEEDGR